MKNFILLLSFSCLLFSCRIFSQLHSTTTIGPNNRFELGENKHGSFKVELKNISNQSIRVVEIPNDGGSHSPQIVKPNERVKVSVAANTALYIENPSNDTISVKLKVTGDTGLSMGYQH